MLKSHKHSKMIKTHFLSFVFHNDWLQKQCCLSVKSRTPTLSVVVNVLLSIYCHLGSGMPYLHIFCWRNGRVIRCNDWLMGVKNSSVIGIRKQAMIRKNVKANCIACELLVKRVVTFGVVLYRNHWLLNFAELQIGSSIKYKIFCLEYIFSNVIKSKEF